MLGCVFQSYIPEKVYGHWGWGDLDMIYGNVESFLTGNSFGVPIFRLKPTFSVCFGDEILNHDVVTLTDDIQMMLLKGQFTIFKNNYVTRSLFNNTRDELLQGIAMEKTIGFEERRFSVNVFMNDSLTFYVQNSQIADSFYPYQIILEWNKGNLYFYAHSTSNPRRYLPRQKYFPFFTPYNKPGCKIDTWDIG